MHPFLPTLRSSDLPGPADVAGSQPGSHIRQDIIDLLGSPSTVSTFEDRKWYYIGQKTQQVAFMKPEVLDRNVLVITFDETGLVEGTQHYDMADAQNVDPVGRETPTEGRRSEEHTSELQSLLRISYAVFCLKKKTHNKHTKVNQTTHKTK